MTLKYSTLKILSVATLGIITLSGCASDDNEGFIKKEAKYPTGYDRGLSEDIYAEPEGIFGEGGLFFNNSKREEDSAGTGIGVNSYLWRAALDTISFMPIASADPFGGTVITDWYAPAQNSNERFKLNVFILDRKLSANGVRVTAFKQVRRGSSWVDMPADKEMGTKLEDTILTRARQMRISQLDKP